MKTDDEKQFLDSYDAAEFEHPSVTVDVAILSAFDGRLHALVVRRSEHPFRDTLALPGGFVALDESLDAAATRVLSKKTGLDGVYLEQLYTFGSPDRDPRTRVITVAYYALLAEERFESAVAVAERSAKVVSIEVPWDGETGGPVEAVDAEGRACPLAFDHDEILGMAVKRIRGKLNYTPIGFQLLPESFTLLHLQEVHETVLGRPLNKDSFRRRMLASGQLEATGEKQGDVGHRPAALYRFSRRSAV